jgi:hypothetical protein
MNAKDDLLKEINVAKKKIGINKNKIFRFLARKIILYL